MSTSLASTVTLTAVPTMQSIIPVTGTDTLTPPSKVTATFHTATNILNLTATIQIPVEITISQVTVQQYYSSSQPNTLQFYFVYNLVGEGSGNFQTINCAFNALNIGVDAKPIALRAITSTLMLMCDLDPKTSRGTVTAVRSVTDV